MKRRSFEGSRQNSESALKVRSKASDGQPGLLRMRSGSFDKDDYKEQQRSRVMAAYRIDGELQTPEQARPGLLARTEAKRGFEPVAPKQMIIASGVEGGPLS